jgi:hypothetical protein
MRIGLIWSDRVNLSNPGVSVVVVFVVVRGQSEQQSGQFSATIDQSDIRGSKPHNLDPSGAASDCCRCFRRCSRTERAAVGAVFSDD